MTGWRFFVCPYCERIWTNPSHNFHTDMAEWHDDALIPFGRTVTSPLIEVVVPEKDTLDMREVLEVVRARALKEDA